MEEAHVENDVNILKEEIEIEEQVEATKQSRGISLDKVHGESDRTEVKFVQEEVKENQNKPDDDKLNPEFRFSFNEENHIKNSCGVEREMDVDEKI